MRRTALISSSFLGRVLAAGHLLAGAILGAALAPGQAYADCPATYAGLSCGALAPVCAVSSTTWTCNVTAGASTAWTLPAWASRTKPLTSHAIANALAW